MVLVMLGLGHSFHLKHSFDVTNGINRAKAARLAMEAIVNTL
jgi:hypothetical protein